MLRKIFIVSGLLIMPLILYVKATDYIFFDLWKIPIKKIDTLINFLIFLITLNTAVYLLTFFYRKRRSLPNKKHDNLIAGVNNIYYLILFGGSLATLLLFLGFDLFTFFTSLSIFAAALAILSKDYISNVVSGMLIAFSEEINIGDTVQIGTKKGKVVDITLSKFILLNDDDDYVILPNNTVFSNDIINFTRREIRKTSIDFEIDIKNQIKVEVLEKVLIDSINKYHTLIKSDSYRLKIVEIRKDYISMKFQYILKEPDREMEREIRRITVRKIVSVIKENQDSIK